MCSFLFMLLRFQAFAMFAANALWVSQDAQGHVVGLVENLVKSYIGDDNSLVLLARPMTEDANNSTAARYVKEMRADHRCMG